MSNRPTHAQDHQPAPVEAALWIAWRLAEQVGRFLPAERDKPLPDFTNALAVMRQRVALCAAACVFVAAWVLVLALVRWT